MVNMGQEFGVIGNRDDTQLDVTFKAEMSESKYCMCDCCHGCSNVLIIEIPKTLYWDGKHLTARINKLWICPDCLKKLREAIANAAD